MIRKDFRFTVKYVKHTDTKVGIVTKFQIGDRIKDGDGFVNYSCTMFGDLPITDGDKIRIKEIDSIEVRAYTDRNGNDRQSFDLVVKAEPEGEYVAPAVEESEGDLPFDL